MANLPLKVPTQYGRKAGSALMSSTTFSPLRRLLRTQVDTLLDRYGYGLVKGPKRRKTAHDLAYTALAGTETPFVVDVGAANGDFASAVLVMRPAARVICVDPIARHVQHLQERFVGRNVEVLPVALGDHDGVIVFHEASHPHSSSVLAMTSHKEHFPTASTTVADYEVPLHQVDTILAERAESPVDLLKIDTQGYELPVLRGARQTLPHCRYVILEMSLRPLYAEQASFQDVLCFMRERGFLVVDYAEGARSHTTGELMQMDFLYCRQDAPISEDALSA